MSLRGPIGFLLVVAALCLSIGVQALMAGAQREAMVLLGAGAVASAMVGGLGWRALQE